jgi:hypothetical protein
MAETIAQKPGGVRCLGSFGPNVPLMIIFCLAGCAAICGDRRKATKNEKTDES